MKERISSPTSSAFSRSVLQNDVAVTVKLQGHCTGIAKQPVNVRDMLDGYLVDGDPSSVIPFR
jgi:hypothetical protein